MSGGKWAILAMLGIGTVLGAVACWVHYTRGRRAIEFWGVEGANEIRHSPNVELLQLAAANVDDRGAPSDPSRPIEEPVSEKAAETLDILGRPFRVASRVDIGRRPGLVHARHSLIVDDNLDFGTGRQDGGSEPWTFAVRFSGGRQTVTVAFAPDTRRVVHVQTGRRATLVEHINAGWLSLSARVEAARAEAARARDTRAGGAASGGAGGVAADPESAF